MKLKVYADRMSQPYRAVIIFCKVNGIEFDKVVVDQPKQQNYSKEYKVLDEKDRDRFLGPHKKVQEWVENTRKATHPHFDEVTKSLIKVKAMLQARKSASGITQIASKM